MINQNFSFLSLYVANKNRLINTKTNKNAPQKGILGRGHSKISLFIAISSRWMVAIVIPILFTFVNPAPAGAGFFSFIATLFTGSSTQAVINDPISSLNSQTMPLLQSATNFSSSNAVGGGDITVVDNEALMSENGPSGTLADIGDSMSTGQISKYTVRKGDSLSSIAKMFGVSINTIIWANNVSSKTIKEGQVLVILPVSGTIHTIVKGDTLKTIAKKYKADSIEIAQYNGIDMDAQLAVGDEIIIPDGESAIPVLTTPSKTTAVLHGAGGPDYGSYYVRPLIGGTRTQKLHGYNAVDYGTPVGTPILASAGGEVIISKISGWNSGYGNYIVISHDNGTQTLYAHLSANVAFEGERISQGQVIGLSGGKPGMAGAGKSTGPHLHFEIRGAKNPFGY